MKKQWMLFIIVMMFTLSACTEPSDDHLLLTLNPGVDTIDIGETHTDAGAKASYGLRFLDVEVIENDVNINEIGVYEIVYQATYSGITKTMTRIVTVIDETPPTMTLNPGVDTIYINQTWVDAGVEVSDLSGEEIVIVVEGEVLNVEGEYSIIYYATDINGNTSQLTRYVSVIANQGS